VTPSFFVIISKIGCFVYLPGGKSQFLPFDHFLQGSLFILLRGAKSVDAPLVWAGSQNFAMQENAQGVAIDGQNPA